MQVKKDHVEFAFFEEARGLVASCQRQSIHTGGIQYSLDQFTRCCFIVHHKSSSLHFTLQALADGSRPVLHVYEDGLHHPPGYAVLLATGIAARETS